MTTPSIDRLPPYSQEAEQGLIGSVLIDPDAILEIDLEVDEFYRNEHRLIWRAVLDLEAERSPIDIVTLAARLDHLGVMDTVGGSSYLTGLINRTPTSVNAAHYAAIVHQKAVSRALIGVAGRIAGVGYDDEPADESMEKAEKLLFDIAKGQRVNGRFRPLKDLLHEAYDRLDFLVAAKKELAGLSSGIPALDRITSGFQRGDLVLLAARPGVGKTSLALNMASSMAAAGKGVGFFSLEMSQEQLVSRLISGRANVDSLRLRQGWLDAAEFGRLATAMNDLSEWQFFIDDTAALGPMQLRSMARRLQMEQDIDIIFVDYLQLMRANLKQRDANRTAEVTEISGQLKALARELDVPVVALAQLSRQIEQRAEKQPRLSDLRESGSLEADSDLVMFLYRLEERDDDTLTEPIMLDIAKHRTGPTGTVKLRFEKRLTRFLSESQ